MDSDAIWRSVGTQRAALADLLESLSTDQWTAESLCDGWRVRDVAGFPLNAARRLQGIRLIATDADFAAGQGRELRAPISDIVMVLAGRSDPGAP